MNKKSIYTAVLSLTLVAGAAFAQDRNDHNDNDRRGPPQAQQDNHRDNNRGDNRGDNRGNGGGNGGGNYGGRDDHNDNDHDRRNDRRDYQAHNDNGPRGAGPRHDMRRGQRIPSEYRSNQYVVSDWRSHHLSAPPRGQHWVQTGNDYVLVAVATGIIASVLLGN